MESEEAVCSGRLLGDVFANPISEPPSLEVDCTPYTLRDPNHVHVHSTYKNESK